MQRSAVDILGRSPTPGALIASSSSGPAEAASLRRINGDPLRCVAPPFRMAGNARSGGAVNPAAGSTLLPRWPVLLPLRSALMPLLPLLPMPLLLLPKVVEWCHRC